MNGQFFEVFSPFQSTLWHMSVCNSQAAVMENFTKYYLVKYKMSLFNRKMTIISWSKVLGKKVFAAKKLVHFQRLLYYYIMLITFVGFLSSEDKYSFLFSLYKQTIFWLLYASKCNFSIQAFCWLN